MTESACLLQTGALYTRRIGLRSPSGGLLFAGIKRGAFSLYNDDAPIYHFDLAGRWQRLFLDGIHYRKALDNSVVAIDRVREGVNLVLKRRTLPFAEVADLDDAVRDVALGLAARLSSSDLERVYPPESVRPMADEELRTMLDRIASWDATAWFRHREKTQAAYGPQGFLPPDAHQAIVLQATLGDDRRLGFAGREPIEHAARTPEEFLAHARSVAELLGPRVLQNNGVFLGEGDVLRRPFGDVVSYFDAISSVFPLRESSGPLRLKDRPEDEPSLGGIDIFLDDLGPGLPDAEGLRLLKAKGLRRANLGIESGDESIRRACGATWGEEEARDFVGKAREAGVVLGLIVLVGTGGREKAERHVAATAGLINSLPLGSGDLVYLIDATEIAGHSDVDRLAGKESQEQGGNFKNALAGVREKGAKVISYQMEKQWN